MTKKYIKEKKAIQKYNAQINRFKKKNYGKYGKDLVIPKKINNVNDYFKEYTKNPFKKSKNENLYNFEFNGLELERQKIVKELRKEVNSLKNKKIRNFGKKEFLTYSQAKDEYYMSKLNKLHYYENIKLNELDKQKLDRFKGSINRYNFNKSHDFKNSYIDIFLKLGFIIDYDTEKLEEIRKKLNEMSEKDFVEFFRIDKGFNSLVEFYKMIQDDSVFNNTIDDIESIYNKTYEFFGEDL